MQDTRHDAGIYITIQAVKSVAYVQEVVLTLFAGL